ncbi:MAG TPA: hypothetical protein VFV54_10745, partial [Thermoanaerobaculia bacterium]|nr:hypothetical protein [Thermoanaerobaculia bacterium]
MTADNWRVICPCQRHSRRRFRLGGRKRQIFLFAGSLILLGASVPLDALETAVLAQSGGLQVVEASAQGYDRAARDRAINLIQPVAGSFGASVQLPSPLQIERVREEFFRTEIP